MQPLSGIPGFPLLPGQPGLVGSLPGLGLGGPRPGGLVGLPGLSGLPLSLGSLGLPTLGGMPPLPGGLPGGLPGLSFGGGPGVAALQASLFAQAQAKQLGLGVRPIGILPKSVAASTSKSSMGAPPALLSKAPPAAGAPGGPAPCTVYVGRISTEVADDFVKKLLEKCGRVTKWNRASDPNTSKLTSFGFCEFEEPQAVWRALCFLHDKQLCDKRLLVKCEEVSTQNIRKWKDGRREDLENKREDRRLEAAAKQKEPQNIKGESGPEKMGESDGKKQEHGQDNGDGDPPKEQTNKGGEPKEEKDNEDAEVKQEPIAKIEVSNEAGGPLDDEQLELELLKESQDTADDIAKLLSDKSKGFPEVKIEASAEDKDSEIPPIPVEEKKDGKENEKDIKKDSNDKENDKNREGSRERKRARSEDKKKHVLSRHYRPSRRERDREQRVRDRDRDIEKEYQYRIREFERAEESRRKNLKRDLQDLELPGEPSEREKRKFVERDLNFSEADEREWKRYREDRKDHRLREREKDAADREAEQRELDAEERKKKDEERKKRKQAEEERQKKEEEERKLRKAEEELRRQERLAAEEEKRRQQEEERQVQLAEQKKEEEAAAAKLLMSIQADMQNMDRAAGPSAVSTLFRDGDESGRRPKPSAPPGDAKLRDDEMRRLIQQVPTDKASAFAFDIDWGAVQDHQIIEKKLRPWVKKKVTEYLGAEEQGMIEFIMRKVASQTRPDTILAELEGFLDEEAENFTLKMWRMLIFEVLRVKAR